MYICGMKHKYEIRVDYKDVFGNDIRNIYKCRNKLDAQLKYWRYSQGQDLSVTFLKDGQVTKKIIA